MELRSDIQATPTTAQTSAMAAQLLDRLPVGVIVYDSRLRVAFANLTARTWFPARATAVELLESITIEQNAVDWQSILRSQLRDASTQQFTGRYQKPGTTKSQLFEFTVSNGSWQDGGDTLGVITVGDVTERRSSARRNSTQDRMAAIGKVAAKVAHELNNPLDGVLRYAGLARRRLGDQADAKALDYLDRIQDGVRRMTGIVRDLLEFSRTHTNVDRPATVQALLEDALEATAASLTHVEVNLNIAPNVSNTPIVNGDGLLQVFCNLLKNAVDAMNAEGQLTVSVTESERQWVIRFEDSGPGVGDDPEKLFTAFYTTKPYGEGTGLGLAVCRELISARGGRIYSHNRPASGACFTIELPAPTEQITTTSEEGAADE